MENNTELPKDAIAALEAGNKIEAIKCTRAAYSLDLITAKNMVEGHLLKNPDLNVRFIAESKKNTSGCLPLLIALIAVAAVGTVIFFAINR